ncbi:MAG TPA: tripartite tricarboxylate transporter substrate binding protein [Roseomonas sp.]
MRRRGVMGLAAGLLATPALAQERYPERPIRMLVPWAPGGTTDVLMRALCEAAGKALGQPMIVENRSGAGGMLGAQTLAHGTRPDGYTLAQMPLGTLRAPLMTTRPPYDPMRDFTWIAQLSSYLFGIAVRADAPWRDWDAFLRDAKARPGRITYGSPGVGSSPHITMAEVSETVRAEWIHVPFRGAAEAVQNLMGSQVDAIACDSTWGELVQAGQFRLLCTWGAQRAARFQDVPTLRELGIDIVSASPYGVAGPAGMTPEVVRRLEVAFRDALQDPAHLALLQRYDMSVTYLDSAAYTAEVRRQYEADGAMIRRLGLRLN